MSANEDVHAAMHREAAQAQAGADAARAETAHRRKWAYIQEATLKGRMADPDRDWGEAGVPATLEEAARRSFGDAGPEAEVRRGSKPGLVPERPMLAVWVAPASVRGRCRILAGIDVDTPANAARLSEEASLVGMAGEVASVVAGPNKDMVRLKIHEIRVPIRPPAPNPSKALEVELPANAVQPLPDCDPEF